VGWLFAVLRISATRRWCCAASPAGDQRDRPGPGRCCCASTCHSSAQPAPGWRGAVYPGAAWSWLVLLTTDTPLLLAGSPPGPMAHDAAATRSAGWYALASGLWAWHFCRVLRGAAGCGLRSCTSWAGGAAIAGGRWR
jgi:hypothetical protein